MHAVVLAGGKGTRLKPFTEDLSKALVPVGGTPIIEILLRRFHADGVRKVWLAVNHRADQIAEHLGDGSGLGLEITYSREEEPLSTVGPLKLIDDLPEQFLVANADILTDLNVAELYRAHAESGALVTVAVYQRQETHDYGVIETDGDNRVCGFEEKPVRHLLVSMGIYCFSRSVLALVPDKKPFGFDDLMHLMLQRGEKICAFPFDGYWLDIGRPDDYAKAEQDIVCLRETGGRS